MSVIKGHIFSALSKFIKRYTDNIRRASILQILGVPVFAIAYAAWTVRRMATQFPIDRTHSLLLWTVPAVLIWLLFFSSKPLRYSPFWFLRIMYFGLAGYLNVTVLF